MISPLARLPLGDTAWQWTLADTPSRDAHLTVMGAWDTLRQDASLQELGAHDIVPAYTSLCVYFSQSPSNADLIAARVESLLLDANARQQDIGKTHDIPTVYNGEDLERVAEHTGLSPEGIMTRHTAPEYRVAMIGFVPHFPYLLGLDSSLCVPRRETPRTHVPAGAVAIGGTQTGVYPMDSPGGWHIIGHCEPTQLHDLNPGDRVRFVAQETL